MHFLNKHQKSIDFDKIVLYLDAAVTFVHHEQIWISRHFLVELCQSFWKWVWCLRLPPSPLESRAWSKMLNFSDFYILLIRLPQCIRLSYAHLVTMGHRYSWMAWSNVLAWNQTSLNLTSWWLEMTFSKCYWFRKILTKFTSCQRVDLKCRNTPMFMTKSHKSMDNCIINTSHSIT